jgi:hypothetical protein
MREEDEDDWFKGVDIMYLPLLFYWRDFLNYAIILA